MIRIALILALGALCIPSIGYAQDSAHLNISVSPVSLDLTVTASQHVESSFRVYNNTDHELHAKISLKKIIPAEGSEGYQLADATPQDDFISWISYSPVLDIPAQQWATVPFTITVPKTTQHAYYPVFFIQDGTAVQDDLTTQVAGGVGVITAITVASPNAILGASLKDFRSASILYNSLPVAFTTVVKNDGNIHVRPRGNIFISSASKKDIAILEVNKDKSAIIPDSSRVFTQVWNAGDRWLIGRFTARLVLVYDTGDRDETISAITTFWIIPWKIILLIIGVIIVIGVVGRFLVRLYIRNVLARAKNK